MHTLWMGSRDVVILRASKSRKTRVGVVVGLKMDEVNTMKYYYKHKNVPRFCENGLGSVSN